MAHFSFPLILLWLLHASSREAHRAGLDRVAFHSWWRQGGSWHVLSTWVSFVLPSPALLTMEWGAELLHSMQGPAFNFSVGLGSVLVKPSVAVINTVTKSNAGMKGLI